MPRRCRTMTTFLLLGFRMTGMTTDGTPTWSGTSALKLLCHVLLLPLSCVCMCVSVHVCVCVAVCVCGCVRLCDAVSCRVVLCCLLCLPLHCSVSSSPFLSSSFFLPASKSFLNISNPSAAKGHSPAGGSCSLKHSVPPRGMWIN